MSSEHADFQPAEDRSAYVLAKVIEAMSLEMDFEQACRYAARVLMETCGADICALGLPGRTGTLRFRYIWGLPSGVVAADLPPVGTGSVTAFQRGQNVFVEDYPSWDGAIPGFVELGIRSGFAVPIVGAHKVIGVLTLAWLHHVQAPDHAQLRLIESVVRQIGIAHHRQLLMSRLAESEQSAVALNERLNRVLSVSPAVIYHLVFDPTRPAPHGLLETSFLSNNVDVFLGYSSDYFSDDPGRWYAKVHPDDLPSVMLQSHPEAFSTGVLSRVYRICHADGHYVWVHDSLRLFQSMDSPQVEIVGAIVDISERVEAEFALQETQAKYRALVEQSIVAVYVIQDGKFSYINPKLAEMLGYSPEEVLSAPSLLVFFPESEHAVIRESIRSRLDGEADSAHYVTHVKRRNGDIVDIEVYGTVTEINGRRAIVGVGVDITERNRAEAELLCHRDHLQDLVRDQTLGLRAAKEAAEKAMLEARQAEQQIRHLAHVDSLTGVPNRVLFLDRLRQAIANADRHGTRLAVMFIDLDRFKHINDSLGHFVGDKLLQGVAGRLQSNIRQNDTVSRQGGDEFVILLSEIENPAVVADIAEKLLAVVAMPYSIDGYELTVTLSIGICIYPDDGSDIEDIIRKADSAMYRAKEEGRNTYQFFAQEMSAAARERLALENELRRALAREQFVLHYQPQIAVDTGQMVGVEALIRWHHPELGSLLPGRFIGLAEEAGLIYAIGQWVIRTACVQVRSWQQAGLKTVPVAVNLSAIQFRRREFPGDVAEILAETGLNPAYLKFELTESVLMHDAEATYSALQKLKDMGLELAIDDFGTGYSSLSYLKRFPIDTLKIDRTFVQDIPGDGDDVAITHAIIRMAHSLRLDVVAEGVETEAQLAFLVSQGCDLVQGNYFNPPLTAGELTQLLGHDQP